MGLEGTGDRGQGKPLKHGHEAAILLGIHRLYNLTIQLRVWRGEGRVLKHGQKLPSPPPKHCVHGWSHFHKLVKSRL